ncbi:sulfite exporter TauE/SafE family protein [Polyangium aurulentum]|uniref:sulfite exporter TauE/SafE family protein n=1 Tax=Polyangium aurulentum TaxID=2567896 RepID=UPI0010AE6B4D|nr:sulfite exporter TauE/SafE family protein [Polyangium aurulentum]UQA57906.1 sulfite exporter TauE/SafE family protein [Polyangium aurulentum]
MDGQTVAFILTGALVGTLSGLLGIGGALVLVPVLMFGFGFTQARAQGTSIGALVPPIGIFAAIQYYKNGLLDMRAAAFIALGFVFGALLGASAVPYVPQVWLKRAFASILVYVAVQLVFATEGKKAAVLPGMIAVGFLWIIYGVRRAIGQKPNKPKRPEPPQPETEYYI